MPFAPATVAGASSLARLAIVSTLGAADLVPTVGQAPNPRLGTASLLVGFAPGDEIGKVNHPLPTKSFAEARGSG
jgi:hypothetical protein